MAGHQSTAYAAVRAARLERRQSYVSQQSSTDEAGVLSEEAEVEKKDEAAAPAGSIPRAMCEAEVDQAYADIDAMDAARDPPPARAAAADVDAVEAVESAARMAQRLEDSTGAERDVAFFEQMKRSKEAERTKALAGMDATQRERFLAEQAERQEHERRKSQMLGKQMKTYAKRSSATVRTGRGSRGRGRARGHRNSTVN